MARQVLGRIGKAAFWMALALSVTALGACSSNSSNDEPVVDVQPDTQPTTLPSGPLKASDIQQALSDKSFRYSRSGGRTGTVTFHADGTFDYNEDGKGAGTGIWQASEGKLCESFDPVSFMPKGTRSECRNFSANGAAYTAGDARFEPA